MPADGSMTLQGVDKILGMSEVYGGCHGGLEGETMAVNLDYLEDVIYQQKKGIRNHNGLRGWYIAVRW